MTKDYMLMHWVKDSSKNKEFDYDSMYTIILMVCGFILVETLREFLNVGMNLAIDQRMFGTMFKRLLNAPINLFFDNTPTGKIINRFSDDLGCTVSRLPSCIMWNIRNFIIIGVTMSYVAYNAPHVLYFIPVLAVVYVYIFKNYINIRQQFNKIEKVSRSPIMTHFNESLSGVSTIRTFQKIDVFEEKN